MVFFCFGFAGYFWGRRRMSGLHIVPFYCISSVYGNKESENCPYSRFFCPYSRISFPYFASTNWASAVMFLPCRRRRNVFRKNSPCFCHTKPRVMNVWDRPKYHPKCRVACSKKASLIRLQIQTGAIGYQARQTTRREVQMCVQEKEPNSLVGNLRTPFARKPKKILPHAL